FRLDRLDGAPAEQATRRFGKAPLLVIPISGKAQICGEAIEPGQCGFAPSLGDVAIDGPVLLAQPCTT
ncbi:MAG: mannose-6-phosphate isomerase, partial [Nevskiales bacterium]